MSILINTTSKPIETHHVSWYIYQDNRYLVLMEIVENYYEHPQSEGLAMIPKIETIERKRVLESDDEAAQLRLLKDILQTTSNIYKGKTK